MPFQKGNTFGKGRPRVPEIDQVRQAMAETEIENKKSLWKHLIEECYKDNNVLIAVAKKFMPDKIEDESFKNLARTFLVRAVEGMKEDIKNAD